MSDELFADVDRTDAPAAACDGEVRLETANRTQVELTPTDLESLLPPGHAARLVWRFVEGLDLSAFTARIRSREGRAGRPAIDPQILVALWLYATIDGVGSAREVDRLCYAHDAYRWLRGGVSVNYHTLSSFRVGHGAALDALLTQSITVLLDKRVVTLNRIAQDGTKIRASAGVRSFKRGERLRDCQQMARQQVARTKAEADGAAPAARAAAQQRAATERLARVEDALGQLPAVEAVKKRNKSKAVPRVSTTDPDARVMKLMDGGYRPAFNVEFATDVDSQVVVGVAVTNVGSDHGQLGPMLTQLHARTGRYPQQYLADAGFVSVDEIRGAQAKAVVLYAPIPDGKNSPGLGGEGSRDEAVAAWRTRMHTDEAKQIYRARAGTAERINADVKQHRTLGQLGVRGLRKVHCWVWWVALAHNVMRAMEIVPHMMT